MRSFFGQLLGRTSKDDAAARAKALEEYLSVVSHELRNPLVGIGAAAQVLSNELAQDSPQRARATAIVAEATHLLALLEELSDATRLESGSLRSVLVPVDLSHIVATAVGSQHAPDHPVVMRGTERALPVRADERRIRQVVANLLGNALAYAPPGTQVEVVVGESADGRSGLVRIRDHGPGIPPAERDRLFTRFARLSTAEGTRGSGLGLYICRGLIADHGGELWADHPADGGASFAFSLPLVAPTGARAPAKERAAV